MFFWKDKHSITHPHWKWKGYFPSNNVKTLFFSTLITNVTFFCLYGPCSNQDFNLKYGITRYEKHLFEKKMRFAQLNVTNQYAVRIGRKLRLRNSPHMLLESFQHIQNWFQTAQSGFIKIQMCRVFYLSPWLLQHPVAIMYCIPFLTGLFWSCSSDVLNKRML